MNWSRERPPAVGWYTACTERTPGVRRHWNGKRWSAPTLVGYPPNLVERARTTRGESQAPAVEWTGEATEHPK